MIQYVDLPDQDLVQAFERGRHDPCFFSHYFLRRKLHDGQAEFVTSGEATINVLATANRYGKTTVVSTRHLWRCFYKVGGEARYTNSDGSVNEAAWYELRYQTIHTAGLWDTCSLVWADALKIIQESPRIRAFIEATPRTLPPHIKFRNGALWKFRTLGDHGEGIDGNSFYLVSIDEAGWISNLREIMDNVARVRVADVRGVIDILGTFKPGIGRDFYTYAVRASQYTGRGITFDHRDGRDYFREFGFDLEAPDAQ